MTKPSFFLAAIVMSHVACGDGGSGTVAPDQIYEALSQTWCDVLRRCPFDNQEGSVLSLFAKATSASGCATYIESALSVSDYDLEAEVAAGRLIYDAVAFQSCLTDFSARCTIDSLDSCAGVFHGTVPVGESCMHNEECVADAWCDQLGVVAGATCGGTCKARVGLGLACTSSDTCSVTSGAAECSFDTNTCLAVTFDANLAIGARCGQFVDGQVLHKTSCAAGLMCQRDNITDENRCVEPLALGASCSAEGAAPCAIGSSCVHTSETEATCAAIVLSQEEGTACTDGADGGAFVGCSIFDRLACIDRKCQQLGAGTAGSKCAGGFDFAPTCDRGLYCRSDNVCAPLEGVGLECSSSSECESDDCTNSQCQPPATCD